MSPGLVVEGRKRAVWEFVPEDYFRELSCADVFPGAGDQPMEVDLGCGDGSFLVGLAEAFPERRFLGVERLLGRVRKVSKKAERLGLENVKVLRLDSSYTLEWLLPKSRISRVHLLCPDPWPKKRHQKRRVVGEDFVRGLERVLEPGGEFLFKSDHSDYFAAALEVVDGSELLVRTEWGEGAFFYPETDFERRWIAEGREMRRARYVRV